MSEWEFSLPLRVYIEDTDAGGIVFYVNYLKFMERARTEFMRQLGFGKDAILNRDLMFVVRDVALHYHLPARLDDELLATAAIDKLGGASMTLRQTVRRGEDTLVSGTVTIACVVSGGVTPMRMPPEMRDALKQWSTDNK